MANLSNINNKFLVTTGGNVLIGQTSAIGSSIFQVTGASTFTGNILMGNTVANPASGFADQTGIGLKYSTTVPELQVSSDSTAMQLGRTSTGGDGQIMALRYASNTIHSFNTNNVSIGTNATFAGNIRTGTSTLTANTNFDNLVIEGSAHTGITIFSGTSSDGGIYFGDSGANNLGQIKYLHGSNAMTFATNDGAASLTLDSSQNSTFAGDVKSSTGTLWVNTLTRLNTSNTILNAVAPNDWALNVTHSTTTAGYNYGILIDYAGSDPNNDANYFIQARDSVGVKFRVASNGGVQSFGGGDSYFTGNVGIGVTGPDFALDIEAVSSGVQLQMGRTTTSAGSTWMGSDSNGFHLGVGAYGAGNSVSDPNGFTVNTSGNVGIGVTPEAHYGGYEVLDIGNSLSLISNNTSTNVSILTNNAYLNSGATAWVRKVADEATMYEQVSGEHRFSNAGSAAAGTAISWSERMRISSTGSIGMGANSASYKLRVKSDATVNNGIYLSAGTGSSNHSFYVENQDGSAEFFAVRGDGEIRFNATSGHTYAAQGIRFGANDSTNNLNYYKEGTWTPTIKDLNGNLATLSAASGTYTKIGRQVFLNYRVQLSSKASMANNYVLLGGLPFNHPTGTNGSGTIDYFQNMATGFSSLAWDTTSTGSVCWLVGNIGTSSTSSVYVTPAQLTDTTMLKGTIIYMAVT